MSNDVLIPVVDKNDNLLCYKPRGALEPGDIGRITSLWVMNSSGCVLLAQRSYTKRHDPGLWSGAVAGTVEKGETYESNIIKEAAEEIGFYNLKPDIVTKFLYHGNKPFICTIFKVVIDQPIYFFQRQEKEIEQLIWMPYSDLITDLKNFPEKYIPSLPNFLKHVQRLHEGNK